MYTIVVVPYCFLLPYTSMHFLTLSFLVFLMILIPFLVFSHHLHFLSIFFGQIKIHVVNSYCPSQDGLCLAVFDFYFVFCLLSGSYVLGNFKCFLTAAAFDDLIILI